MSITEKPKFLTSVIIALLLLNFGTLTFMWTQLPRYHQHEPRPGAVFDFIVDELKMTDKQQQQYAELRDEHHSKVEELNMEGRKLHDRFFLLLHHASADPVQVQQLADSIVQNQKQIELVTFYHFQKVQCHLYPRTAKKI